MENEDAFFMVWNPAGRAPTYRHQHHAGALTEAKRLAEAHPGNSYFVLQAIEVAKRHEPVEVRKLVHPNDTVPF